MTKDFCKGNNFMKDVYDAKFLRIRKHFIGFTGAFTERYNARFRSSTIPLPLLTADIHLIPCWSAQVFPYLI